MEASDSLTLSKSATHGEVLSREPVDFQHQKFTSETWMGFSSLHFQQLTGGFLRALGLETHVSRDDLHRFPALRTR